MTRTTLAICLAIAVCCAQTTVGLASPASAEKERSTANLVDVRGHVWVNGEETIAGQTIFSGSEMQSDRNSGAVVSLGARGRAEVLPQSELKFDFGATTIAWTLARGGIRLAAPQGVTASVTTSECVVVSELKEVAVFTVKTGAHRTDISAQAGSVIIQTSDRTVRIGAGEQYTVGQGTPGASPAGNSLTEREKWGIALGIGGAVALILIIIAARDDDEVIFQSPTLDITPTR